MRGSGGVDGDEDVAVLDAHLKPGLVQPLTRLCRVLAVRVLHAAKLLREVPEALKPRKIAISRSAARTVDSQPEQVEQLAN